MYARTYLLLLSFGLCLLLATSVAMGQSQATPAAHTFVVNASGDQGDPYGDDDLCDICHNPGANPPVGPCNVCTLRAAIEQANHSPGANAIVFSYVAQPIQPTRPLPYIVEEVAIDGLDQGTGQSVQLDGSNAGRGVNGLILSAPGCTVRNLTITRFQADGDYEGFGLVIWRGNAVIEGNYLGTNAAGATGLGNDTAGIYIAGTNSGGNRIGGTTAAQRNVIAGNGTSGIQIGDPQGGGIGSANNRIIGNYIGVTPNGNTALPNGKAGIGISHAGSTGNQIGGTNAGEGNVLSGNGWHGVVIQNGASGTLVRGNLIGLNAAGTARIPNGILGVQIVSASNNTIGGTITAARNVIAGNTGGISIIGETPSQATLSALANWWQPGRARGLRETTPQSVTAPAAASGNYIQGNYIGLNAAGSAPLGNTEDGVTLWNASGNTVGGAIPRAGNVIAANRIGVRIVADEGKSATDNLVQSNRIGTDPTGTQTDADDEFGNGNEWGNGLAGIMLRNAATNTISRNTLSGNGHGVILVDAGTTGNQLQGNRIGTDSQGALLARGPGNLVAGVFVERAAQNRIGGTDALSNTIAFNLGRGIQVLLGERNDLRNNRIFGNTEPAIDLSNERRTPNDLNDTDSGPNTYQNYPVFTRREGLYLWGNFSGQPNATYSLDLYTYRVCNAQPWPGFGEGEQWLLTQAIPTDARGHAVFMLTLPSEPPAGYALAGTLTDPNGNTSEFSNAPYRLNVTGFTSSDALTLTGRLDPLQLPALRSCQNLFTDLYVVVDGDANRPLKMEYLLDESGDSRLRWTPTQTETHILDLYLTSMNVGFSMPFFNDRLWLAPAPQVTFYEPNFPDMKTWIPVGSQGTVDGNHVNLAIAVHNPGPEDFSSEVQIVDTTTGQPLPGAFVAPSAATRHTFYGGVTTTVTFQWDTTGFAWSDDGEPILARTIRITLPEQDGRNVVVRPAEAELKLRPRPAVLVHGLWSNAEVGWGQYQSFLTSIRPDWKAYAVGDEQVWGRLNTGALASPFQPANSLRQNAEELRHYIERVRELENAWHVDLVAHSMGGLISRDYLSSLVWKGVSTDGYPVANHLIMLGTPNLGSPCADDLPGLWHPAIMQLRPDIVLEKNKLWRQPGDVPFSIFAGTSFNFTCRSAGPGDGVVEVYSATGEDALGRNVYAPKLQWIYKRALDHVAMTDSEQDFLAYVLPILAAGPDRAHERTLPSSLKATAFDAQASPTSSAKPPQVLERVWLELPVGASRNLAITVPAGEALVVTLVASDTVQAQLRTPQGAAADPFTGSLFRSVWASTPITGNWTVALTNTDATTASVVLGAVILEPVEELVVTVGEPAWDGMTFITATLASTNAPQRLRAQTTTGLTLTARLTNEVGDELLVELRDDGRHGDGAADDGVYGARVGPLDPALYDIFVYALGPDFYRGTTAGVHVPFARIAKTVTPEHPVTQGDPLTYTLVISGPAGATVGLFDPLEDLDFVRFLVQPPGVLYTNGALTGTITLPTTTPVSVTFVATAAVPELADLVTLSNHACVYPATGSVDDCVWSPAVTTDVHVGATTHAIYLPLMLHDYTPRLALTLAYGTYFGGVDEDQIKDIAIGPDGFLYLTGATYSTKPGPDSLGRSYSQVFVAKLTPDGKTLVYYQQFGGTADSGGKALAVDAAGNVYVTGYTQSATFPRTAGAFDQDFNGGADLAMDAFVTKLDATGNIVYSSYLGGSGYDIPGAGASGGSDRGTGIAVLGEYVYVIGWTESSDFPTTPGAYDQVYADADWGLNTDLFIVKLSLGGQGSADLVYGTFLGGGASFEEAADLAIDNAGRLYITGSVEDQLSIGEFPLTPGAVDTIPPAGWQVKKAFLIVFNPVGGGQSDLIYSTYLGGTDRDEGHALALGSDGTVYLTGRTASLDFPTTDGAFDRACGTNSTCNEGRSDAFVTWINPDPTGSAQDNLRYSTYLGGGGGENFDQGTIALIAPGEVYVAGDTGSLTFPTTSDAYAQERNGTGDLFLARLKLAGQGAADLVYGTYIGGSHYDEASYGLARSSDETVTLVGVTRSTDLPVGPEPLYATFNGGYYDGYLFQFGLESVSWRTGPQ